MISHLGHKSDVVVFFVLLFGVKILKGKREKKMVAVDAGTSD